MTPSRPNRVFTRLTVVALCGLLATAVAAVSTAPAAPASQGALYFYDANGRREVTPAANEWIVSVAPAAGAARSDRPKFLPPCAQPAQDMAAITRLEERLARRGLHVVRGGDASKWRGHARVQSALPLLYRPGSPIPLYPTSRIVVALRPGVAEAELRRIAETNNCALRKLERGASRYLLEQREPSAEKALALAARLHERNDLTLYAEPDYYAPLVTYAPPVIQDPYYLSHQWHLDGDVSKGADPNSDINVEAAWDTANGPHAEGRSEVRVAILDECVEKLHPDLFPNWAAGLDVDNIPYDDDPSPDGGQRHGTSCAGVAVAVGNTIGVRGAAPRCGLIGVKFFGGAISDIAAGFYFVVDPDNNGDDSDGAAILSNSWGFADGTLAPADVVASINNAANTGRNGLGCLVLFASANNDHTVNGVSALAQLSTVMAVGGTNSHAMHTEFSDVGPEVGITTPTNDRGDDGVRFPWLDITTVDNTGSSGYNGLPDLDYTNAFGGTSSATPLAAGVLGLILSQDPTMTAAQARAILQHTATRIDEPYGRFDGITGHSHRFGFGRADAAQAVIAAVGGVRWPDRIRQLNATGSGSDIGLSWDKPAADYAGSLLVRSASPFVWKPTDGATYIVGDTVAPGVQVIYKGATNGHIDVGASSGPFFYAVFAYSDVPRYSFGAKNHLIRNGLNIFYDNSEIPDPGWTHGGFGDDWARGTPTASLGFSQNVGGSGPLVGTRGTRAISGNKCWGTDLAGTYDANADNYLQTPLINLTGVSLPVFLEYYDWCMLETFYDRCSVEIVDADGATLGVVEPDTGGDYDWTRRIYDITSYAGQVIRVRFRLQSDFTLQRDGWFIDEVRVVVGGNVPLAPSAVDVYAETPTNTPRFVTLSATDPNPGDVLTYHISELPAHGQLRRTNGDPIGSVPFMLPNAERVVEYVPATDYEGPDEFRYYAADAMVNSNTARVKLIIGTPEPIRSFTLDSDPGWLREGQWAFGDPIGTNGDPPTGATGPNVYGYNLAGAYANNLPARYLTMPPINCTGLSRVTLGFARWLVVESSTYDKATVEASTDGIHWSVVWTNPSTDLIDTAWSTQSYNLTGIADNQPFVLIRWGMGPTDSSVVGAGWNLDDIVISAIGTPQANQPPYAHPAAASTAVDTPILVDLAATDGNGDPLTFTIMTLPAHGALHEPGGDPIAAVPHNLPMGVSDVEYCPAMGYSGPDEFEFRATDGALASNIATASITVLRAATFPLEEGFESGALAEYWRPRSTGTGRIRVVSTDSPIGLYHVELDSSQDSSSALNELDLVIDLDGASDVLLRYHWKEFGEEDNALPNSWMDSTEGDGVAISADGKTWHKVANLIGGTTNYAEVLIDLDAAAAAAGIAYNKTFRIRFQQYDNFPIPTDGIALDQIRVIQGSGDPLIATESLPDGRVGQTYGPIALLAVGGDPPLEWTLKLSYEEQDLNTSDFMSGGVAQNWNANDGVWDYALPFNFWFYGESHSMVRVGSDGWLNFGPHVGSTWNNSTVLLQFNKRIAPLWDDLRTDQGGNIFVDSSSPGRVTFRWAAKTFTGGFPANFACTLFADGSIRFDYGGGNTGLTPTIGISQSDQVRYLLASYNGTAALTNADSLLIRPLRLPFGLSLAGNGEISGVPTAAGVQEALFEVRDDRDRTDMRRLSIAILPQVPGDFDDDGDVDGDDFARLLLAYGAHSGDENYDALVDLDQDGAITLVDYQMWLQHYRDANNLPGAGPPIPGDAGDLNGDGRLDGDDVAGFAATMLDPAHAQLRARFVADLNGDGAVNGVDLQEFVSILLETGNTADIE